MEDESKQSSKRTVILVLAGLIVLMVALFVIYGMVGKSRLRARLNAIREQGYPVTCAELDAWYSIPEGAENGADAVLEACSHFVEWESPEDENAVDIPVFGSGPWPKRNEVIDANVLTATREFLAKNEEALALIEKASEFEYFRYPTDLSLGMDTIISYLQDVRSLARLSCLDALADIEADDVDSAIDRVRCAFAMGDSLSQEPVLISQLVRIACESMGIKTVERMLNRCSPTEDQLGLLSELLSHREQPNLMTRAYVGERCSVLDALYSGRGLANLQNMPAGFLKVYRATGLAAKDCGAFLDISGRNIEAMSKPYHERLAAAKQVEEDVEKLPKMRVFTKLLCPAYGRIAVLDVRAAANIRVAQLAIAIEQCRLDTGRIPSSLTELAPAYIAEIPTDPFDGKPMRYRALDSGGFVVYSIGEDGSDDGGLEKPEKAREDDLYDITFIVER